MINRYNSRIIIACDFPNKKELFKFLEHFKDEKLFLKLGIEIIYKEGLSIINELKDLGHNIFLDLKLHDIPTSVAHGIKSISKYKVDFLTIHLSGGNEMVKMAQIEAKKHKINLLGVTILTSMNDENLKELNIRCNVEQQVDSLMKIAKKNQLYGVVCSGYEAKIAKKYKLVSVVPGIQIENKNEDQRRTMQPASAIANGAVFIVVGRALTQNKKPYLAYSLMKKEVN